MNDAERRDMFRALVQAGATINAIQFHRSGGMAMSVIAQAWRIPAAALPADVDIAAMQYVEYQFGGRERPAWLPD